MKPLFLSVLMLIGIQLGNAQNTSLEIDGVKAACYDYINAFYQADTSFAYRSVHKSIRKIGFFFDSEKGNYSEQLEMPFNQLVSLAKRWNSTGTRADENTPKQVEIFEVSDKTAVAKVTAVWGIDYISLMKVDDKWMIVNVLWQSPPKFSLDGK
ncbi:MAG: nuclear transport factor 2 family protein [Eudoraea sp.]|nr:nuclear transport factor 2 family protein [Eudoraea sp.]